MATKVKNIIALELNKYEKKVSEFQEYLELVSIQEIPDDQVRHKEIEAQIKIMSSLPTWLQATKNLREEKEEAKKQELRGDGELSFIERSS